MRQCAAVRQCVAVRAAACGSARSSVRQCVAVRVWQCVAVCTVVCAQCARQCVSVRLVVSGSEKGVYGHHQSSVPKYSPPPFHQGCVYITVKVLRDYAGFLI